jgi:Glycosyltransferase like family
VRDRDMSKNQDPRARRCTLTFVACISDDELLHSNLLASPCLAPGSRHEVILVRNARSAAAGLNLGIGRARGDLIVCIHQDVLLPDGWADRLIQQFAMAEREFGTIGVVGVYGVGPAVSQNEVLAAQRIGRVCDRGRSLDEGIPLPERAATLDELLLVIPRGMPLKVDPELGFHLYGADLCLQAAECGLAVVVIDAYCHHNSRSVGLPRDFFASAKAFARKWHHRLPVATPCVIIDTNHKAFVLGNSPRRRTTEISSAQAKEFQRNL